MGSSDASSSNSLLVSSVASLLQHLAQRNTSEGCGAPCFLSATEPAISLSDYVLRLARFFQCSEECFVLTLIYVDRLLQGNSHIWLCPLNVHRLAVTALMLAVKFADDTFYSNAYYAKVGGLPVKEINYLEATLLRLLRFRLHVLPWEYTRFLSLILDFPFSPAAAALPRPRSLTTSSSSTTTSSTTTSSTTSSSGSGVAAAAGKLVVAAASGGPECSSSSTAAQGEEGGAPVKGGQQPCCQPAACCSPSISSTACFSGCSQTVSPPLTPEATADDVQLLSAAEEAPRPPEAASLQTRDTTATANAAAASSSSSSSRCTATACPLLLPAAGPPVKPTATKQIACQRSVSQQQLMDFAAAGSARFIWQENAMGAGGGQSELCAAAHREMMQFFLWL
ncbi:hypothetical protein Efla_005222 [Eimeria flavescens]